MTQLLATTNGTVGTLDGLGTDRDFRQTGRLGIDFALTGGEGPEFEPLERIPTRGELNMWFAWSQLALNTSLATDEDHLNARRLRWSTWHAIQAELTGTALRGQDRDVIDTIAAKPPLVPQLAGAPWVAPTIAQGLSTVARDVIELLRDDFLRGRLKTCESEDCGVPFVDVSRPGGRRWCEDARCGDRHRQREARRRRRERREARIARTFAAVDG